MTQLYRQIMGGGQATPAPYFGGIGGMNPMQRMSAMMQAMQNPMAVVFQAFPDIPEGIRHDAGQILSYLQQSRGISDAQIQAIRQQMPGF